MQQATMQPLTPPRSFKGKAEALKLELNFDPEDPLRGSSSCDLNLMALQLYDEYGQPAAGRPAGKRAACNNALLGQQQAELHEAPKRPRHERNLSSSSTCTEVAFPSSSSTASHVRNNHLPLSAVSQLLTPPSETSTPRHAASMPDPVLDQAAAPCAPALRPAPLSQQQQQEDLTVSGSSCSSSSSGVATCKQGLQPRRPQQLQVQQQQQQQLQQRRLQQQQRRQQQPQQHGRLLAASALGSYPAYMLPFATLSSLDCRPVIVDLCRAMGFTRPSTLLLALHNWGRIESVMGKWTPDQATVTVRNSYAAALVWACAKLEEGRMEVPRASQVAEKVGVSGDVISRVELVVMKLLEWSPYRDFVDVEGLVA